MLMLNCKKNKDGLKKLQKSVAKTKWFKRYEPEDLTMEILEKGYRKVSEKYGAKISYVMNANSISWSFTILTREHKWITNVYSETLTEGMLKVIIVLYAHLVKGHPFRTEED